MSLSDLFQSSLSAASKAFAQSAIEDTTQELVRSCLADLNTLQSRAAALSLFSPNESLEDIATRDLIYLLVPYVAAEVQGRVRTTERDERMLILDTTQGHLQHFLFNLENYEIVSEEDRSLYERRASAISNAGQRREVKIKQYQKEKDLRGQIEALHKQLGFRQTKSTASDDFALISMLLPSGDRFRSSENDEELESETEDTLRGATLLLLRLVYTQAQAHIGNLEQERELLKGIPTPYPHHKRPEEDVQRENRRSAEENMWKLDFPQSAGHGPEGLLDSSGKPLQPFVLLPSEAANRARLRTQVFGPSHQLPTMTVDEYLEIERQRGNILTGGGRASQEAPTSSEKLKLAAETDGTREGDEKEEELRHKEEKWAQFTDENPRGAGNIMNRG
ncbi:hypothetical protein AX17_002870 [Amanita inopinata Kibby_2008]|nr:hypothetical protein AX17_002870 [Amanita inopinata Kibby_2008]